MRSHPLPGLFPLVASLLLMAGCGGGHHDTGPQSGAGEQGRKVATTGKEATALSEVPDDVLRAARSVRPELEIGASEYEMRDGREYYDLAGILPDGTELELDMTRVDGRWTVVEVQRDLPLADVPGPVQQALAGNRPGWTPGRIIESDQGDGVVIYEFFGPGTGGEETKVEVKWQAGAAEVLRDEWLH
jgi:hypothetical protein